MVLFTLAMAGIATMVLTGPPSVAPSNQNSAGVSQPCPSFEYKNQSYPTFFPDHQPLGIADEGIDPATGVRYNYSSSAFAGEATYQSLKTLNVGIKNWTQTTLTFQLNLVYRVLAQGRNYSYWVQDVAQIDSSNFSVNVSYNIWNWSSSGGGWPGLELHDLIPGELLPVPQDPPSGYIRLEVDARTLNGTPALFFRYGGPGINNTTETFAWVTFLDIKDASPQSGFIVDGWDRNSPFNNTDDAEMTIGGPAGGQQTGIVQSDLQFQLERWNGHNWEAPPAAYNYGCYTAEGVYGATDSMTTGQNGIPSSALRNDSQLGEKSTNPGPLYSEGGVSILSISDPTVSGNVTGQLFLDRTTSPIPFSNGSASVVLEPGTYSLYESAGQANLRSLGMCSLLAGETVNITVNNGCSPDNPSIPSVSFSEQPGYQDVSLQISAQVHSGPGPTTIRYLGLPPGCISEDKPEISCVTTFSGTYVVTVMVSNGHGSASRVSTIVVPTVSKLLYVATPLVAMAPPFFAALAATTLTLIVQNTRWIGMYRCLRSRDEISKSL